MTATPSSRRDSAASASGSGAPLSVEPVAVYSSRELDSEMRNIKETLKVSLAGRRLGKL